MLGCERCHEPFIYCGSCEPGRLYCQACSALASRGREHDAHDTYYGSPQGREQRCDEEKKRRDERKKRCDEQAGAGLPGEPEADRVPAGPPEGKPEEEQAGAGLPGEQEADRVPAGPPEGKPEEEQAGAGLPGEPEAANGPVGDRRPGTPPGAVQDVPTVALAAEEPSGGSPALTDVPAGTATQQADQPAAHRSSLEWTLVAWPGFFPAARARVGTTFACPSCERRGLIARVVALAKWRQRHARRGVG